MEMLVTLVLVSLATMLMFQMLGSYRVANQRVQAQSGVIDRSALFHAWFRDTVGGLYIVEGEEFSGDRDGFRGISLNPLFAGEGAPTEVEWRLSREEDVSWISYSEGSRQRWGGPLIGSSQAHFLYIDAGGSVHESWPPVQGLRSPASLPAQVALVRDSTTTPQTLVAAVMGPLEPVLRLIGQDEY